MKDITVTLDDQLYHAAEAAAARQQTNVVAVLPAYFSAFAKGKAPAPFDSPENEDQKDRKELVRLFREGQLILGSLARLISWCRTCPVGFRWKPHQALGNRTPQEVYTELSPGNAKNARKLLANRAGITIIILPSSSGRTSGSSSPERHFTAIGIMKSIRRAGEFGNLLSHAS